MANLSVGIIGLPNVGKSTLFNALLKENQADVSNYPFCTIEPNVGIVEVPDRRLDKIAETLKLPKKIPAPLKFIDIAGLVKGAHKGEGLGNKFLSHIAEVNAIAMVLRAFPDKKIALSESSLDPEKDAKILTAELILKDLEIAEKQIESAKNEAKAGDKEAKKRLVILEKIKTALSNEKTAPEAKIEENQLKPIKDIPLLTLKPIMYIVNISEGQIKAKPKVNLSGPVLYICAKTEVELADFTRREAAEYLKSIGAENSSLEQIIREGYKLLNLITFYTLKPNQIQAWPIPAGTPAPQAAGLIHTDFETGFIKAEVIKYDNLISVNGQPKPLDYARSKGKIRKEGKNYIVKDGDIIEFLFNV